MSIVKDILKEEMERLILLKKQMEKQISSLPNGSLSKKKRAHQYYYYLAYRKGNKVIFKYIGKENSSQVNSIKKDIKKRRKIQKKLKDINIDLKDIVRGLGEK